ncbi:MAG: geranylgeranyl reductase family protein [Flammeovirgaceae bacterium]
MNQRIKASDILIVGAGPAGATASMWFSKHQIPHTIIDKSAFPRDKVCGDAISGKVYSILKQVEPEVWNQLHAQTEAALATYGVRFSAPNGKSLDIHFKEIEREVKETGKTQTLPSGFVMKRLDFDNFLFEKLDPTYADIHLNTTAKHLERQGDGRIEAVLQNGKGEIKLQPKVVIGADGERSIVNKQLAQYKNSDEHFAAAVRAYYTNVSGMTAGNLIELHYIKEVVPGYLWIFPLPNGGCNVGMGILSSEAKKGKRNLRKELVEQLENHPRFKERFRDAKLEGKILGWGLPLGSKKRTMSGDNYILTGDAASLVDPLTGEGIGNAIISGKYAAVYAMEAFEANDFSASFFTRYDQMIHKKLRDELRLSHALQKLGTRPWLINALFNKAVRSKEMQQALSMMFVDIDLRKQLKNPLFYLKILFS